jgi:hypothetical protein
MPLERIFLSSSSSSLFFFFAFIDVVCKVAKRLFFRCASFESISFGHVYRMRHRQELMKPMIFCFFIIVFRNPVLQLHRSFQNEPFEFSSRPLHLYSVLPHNIFSLYLSSLPLTYFLQFNEFYYL